MGIKTTVEMVGHRILLKPADDVADEEIKEGALAGFKLDVGEDWKRQKASTTVGEVVSIGPMAWIAYDGNHPKWKPWCEVGDIVYFAKYGGKFIKIDGEDFIIINDEDVQGIIRKEEVINE
jgi:co-chaperonin GroES (HSP10)